MGERMLGRIPRSRIRRSVAPSATAASAYSIRFCPSVPARASRANCGRPTTATAIPALRDPGPVIATSPMARRTGGIASSVSMPRITIPSTIPPCQPAHRPSGTPTIAAPSVAPSPMASAMRAP